MIVGCSGSPEEVAGGPVQPDKPAYHITGGIAGDVAREREKPRGGAPATSEGGWCCDQPWTTVGASVGQRLVGK
ncbi:hypothetical protein NL676_039261 [Syzygium grande]|nr:hypothetical protein NL676_039261 [Syzygium grande]